MPDVEPPRALASHGHMGGPDAVCLRLDPSEVRMAPPPCAGGMPAGHLKGELGRREVRKLGDDVRQSTTLSKL